MLQYKIVEHRRTGHTEELEQAINTWASEGWVLDQIVEGEMARSITLAEHEILLLVFKKDVKERRSRIR